MKSIFDYIKCSSLLLMLGMALTSCDSDLWSFEDDSDGSYKVTEGNPIATTLDESGEFAEWVKVLNYSDTYSVLNARYAGGSKGMHIFTTFAPTDEALQCFYQSKGVNGIEDLGKLYAQAMVKTMTIDKDTLKLSELFGPGIDVLNYDSENGEELEVEIDTNEEGFLLRNNSGKESIHVSYRYMTASNGFIYTVDGVLNPLVETLLDRMVEAENSSIMLAALQATGYDKKLDTVADTTYVLGAMRVKVYRYALLNVTDEVYAKCGIRSLAELKDSIVSRHDSPELGADSLLKQYVEYHLLDGAYTTANLKEMIGSDTVRIWGTSAHNQIMLISKALSSINEVEEGVNDTLYTYYFNTDNIEGQSLNVENSDIIASNGYVHNLTGWMPVYEPKQTTVVWDLTSYSEVRNYIKEAGKTYQPTAYVSNEEITNISNLSCYTVEQGPDGSKNGTYYALSYVTCKSNLPGCLNNDRLVINVGYMGSVEMQTPTLVKGKYRVSVKMAYLTTMSALRTCTGCKGGIFRLSVDDEHQILTAPYTTISKIMAGVYETDLYEEVEFSETASHTFKITVMDPAASTLSGFCLQFDAIVFTPIE